MNLHLEDKLATLVRILNNWRISKQIPIKVSYVELQNPHLSAAKNASGWKSFKEPYTIFTPEKYIWFKGEFVVNKNQDENTKSYLSIDTFLNMLEDGTCRPQGTLYLNNKLVQGIDINHKDVLINEDGRYTFYLYYYTHNFKHSFPLNFSLKYTDKRVEEAYYDYWTILEDVRILLDNDPLRASSLKVVNEAMNLIDLRNRDQLFFNSLKKSHNYLMNNYFKKLCGKTDYTVECVGHAHIDMAWLWDLEQTHHKGLRTFATALKLMDEYPNYKYMHTTPQIFKFIKEDDPELFARIKKRVKEGRFEIDGAMWVEPDCNLTSGESLVRQILYGKSYLKKEFNIDSKTLVLPDVFGYSYQIPQLLKKSGITRFVTGKIGWNDTNRLPYDSFKWVGLDGTPIFTYFISCISYSCAWNYSSICYLNRATYSFYTF